MLSHLLVALTLLVSPASVDEVAAHGTLIVLNKSDDTASFIDPATGRTLSQLPTGGGPHEVAVSPDGRTAVVANYGSVQGGAFVSGHTLSVYDLTTRTVHGVIDLELNERPHGIQFVGGNEKVVVTVESRSRVVVVDVPGERVVRSISTEAGGSHMLVASPDGKRVYTANMGSASVSVLDLENGRYVTSIPTGAECEGIDITPDGGQVWASNRAANTVSVIDTTSLEVVAELPCADFPIRVKITPDGKRALVSNARSSEVVVFDVSERKEVGRITIDFDIVDGAGERLFGERMKGSATPIGVLIPPDGRHAFVAAANADVVTQVDLETLQVVRGFETGNEPDGLGWTLVQPSSDPSDATTGESGDRDPGDH
jgi:YVTN family beta-propeller protein